MVKDLCSHPVLKVSLLLLIITVLLVTTNTSSHIRLRLGGHVSFQEQLVIRWVGVDVPEEHKWRRRPGRRVLEIVLGQPQVLRV